MLVTCKECIHERVCFALIKTGLPYLDDKLPAEAFCMTFKSKTDVSDVVHGKWIGDKNKSVNCSHLFVYDDWHCSICGLYYPTNHFDFLGKYCPYCGAKMDGDNK